MVVNKCVQSDCGCYMSTQVDLLVSKKYSSPSLMFGRYKQGDTVGLHMSGGHAVDKTDDSVRHVGVEFINHSHPNS